MSALAPPGDHTHATTGRVFGVTPLRPRRAAAPEGADEGDLLLRINPTFAAGLRGASVYSRTDRQRPVFAPGSAPGSVALALQPDQAFLSEMLVVPPGRHTFSFDLRGTPGTRVLARVASSWQTPEGGLLRPVLGEIDTTLASNSWIRLSFPVLVPDGCPGVNIQIGEHGALTDAFRAEAPGWSARPESAGPVVEIDRLCLRPGESDEYLPPAPLALGLASPVSAGLATPAGSALPLVLSVAPLAAGPRPLRLSGAATDILYGTVHPLPLPDTLTLRDDTPVEIPFSLALPAGQFLVEIEARSGTDAPVSLSRPVTFLSPAPPPAPDTPFLGRALYNSASHEACRELGAPSSRLLGDGLPYPLNWQIVQPAPGVFDWSEGDRLVHRLAEAGIAPLVGLLNYNRREEREGFAVLAPPAWVPVDLPPAGAWPTLRKAVPRDLGLWCDYVRAVATRYLREIRVWEVVNEPGGTMDAAAYVRLLAAAHRTLKAVDPGLVVVGVCATGDEVEGVRGGLLSFLEDCLALGAAEHLDVISFHPYVWPHSPERGGLPATLAAIRTLRDRHAPGKPLWCTEIGWNSPVLAPGRPRTERGPGRNLCAGEYTAIDCANFVARGLLHHLGAGVEKIHLFNNPQPGRLHPFRANGLLLFDHDHTPLPVFVAAREVMRRLGDARLLAHQEPAPGAYFQIYLHAADPARLTAVLWRSEEAAAPATVRLTPPPGVAVRAADLFGRASAYHLDALEIPVAPSPVWIEAPAAFADGLRAELARALSADQAVAARSKAANVSSGL